MATINGTGGDDNLFGTGADDTITGSTGNDTITGGGGNDSIVAGPNSALSPTAGVLSWEDQGFDGQNISGGFTQDTGETNVSVSFSETPSSSSTSIRIEESFTQYSALGEGFDSNSSAILRVSGAAGASSTTTFDFSASSGANVADEVQNVRFRLNDLDTISGRIDQFTVRAFDAQGNAVTIDVTANGNDTFVINPDGTATITAGPGNDDPDEATGSVLVSVPGPVAKIELVYTNAGTPSSGSLRAFVSDVLFDSVPTDDDSVDGGAGNDTIFGGMGEDTILGGDGDDSVSGGKDGDSLIGGAGNDTLDYATSDDGVSVDLATGATSGGDAAGDTISGFENITGSGYADTLVGDNDANILDGGHGDDSIDGGDGDDTLIGDFGDDTINGGAGNDSIVAGPDTLATSQDLFLDWTDEGGDETDISSGFVQDTGGINVAVTYTDLDIGTDFDVTTDTQYTGGGPFDANSGAFIQGNGTGANSSVEMDFSAVDGSGFSNEVQNVQFRINDIDRSTWRDVIVVKAYDANGDLVPLTITLGPGTNDSTSGNTIVGGDDNDQPNQADGSALIEIPGPVSRIEVVYANAGSSNQYIYLTDVHFQTIVESDADLVDGGDGDDTIFGGADDDTLLGGAGQDELSGDAGDDSVDGGADDDTVLGGAGEDTLTGGTGDDVVEGGAEDDSLDGGDGSDTLDGGTGDDVGTGGAGDDSMLGGAGSDTLSGGIGSDTIEGGSEADSLSGDAGDDSIDGGTGDDTIDGGEGSDTLLGGDGADTITGGAGTDSFVGGEGADSLSGGLGSDTFFGGTDGDVVVGGEDPGDTDIDVLDLSTAGPLTVTYTPGDPESGTVTFYTDATQTVVSGTMTFSEIEKVIPCFTSGTMITTPAGTVSVEDLKVGDLVLTRDNGARPIRWIGKRTLSVTELEANPRFRPVVFKAGSMGEGLPRQDLTVSPQHRMLIQSADAELLFGEHEVLVAARNLAGRPGIETAKKEEVTYIHLMFDDHEIVLSDGVWSESFQPGAHTLGDMDAAQRAELLALFPQLACDQPSKAYPAARITLKAKEAALLN